MKKLSEIALLGVLILFFIQGCGASTDTRYDKNEENKESKNESEKNYAENFNLTPYHTKIDVEEIKPKEKIDENNLDIWYGFDQSNDTTENFRQFIEKVEGYRVQVVATDNLDEANSIRSEIYFKTNQKEVYVEFDPPLYKVKVGDFINVQDAKDLNFKLNQLGYTESRVISDSVNVFQ